MVGTTVAAGLGAAAGSGLQATVTSSDGTSIAGGIGTGAALGLAASISITATFISGNQDAIRMPPRARVARINPMGLR